MIGSDAPSGASASAQSNGIRLDDGTAGLYRESTAPAVVCAAIVVVAWRVESSASIDRTSPPE